MQASPWCKVRAFHFTSRQHHRRYVVLSFFHCTDCQLFFHSLSIFFTLLHAGGAVWEVGLLRSSQTFYLYLLTVSVFVLTPQMSSMSLLCVVRVLTRTGLGTSQPPCSHLVPNIIVHILQMMSLFFLESNILYALLSTCTAHLTFSK
jgi:hypothetical protein